MSWFEMYDILYFKLWFKKYIITNIYPWIIRIWSLYFYIKFKQSHSFLLRVLSKQTIHAFYFYHQINYNQGKTNFFRMNRVIEKKWAVKLLKIKSERKINRWLTFEKKLFLFRLCVYEFVEIILQPKRYTVDQTKLFKSFCRLCQIP